MFEEYEERIENAKNKRLKMLDRFHIGDAVYPFWLKNFVVYGIVIDIDTVARKIICDFNGVRRQFEPEDLMVLNPAFEHNARRRASINHTANRVAVYYKSSPSQYKVSEDEREQGEALCPKCKSVLEPKFDAATKSVSLVCPDCGRLFNESNIEGLN